MTAPLPLPEIIQAAITLYPGIIEHLSEDALKIVKAAGYDGIRTVMRGEIFGAVFGYLSGSGAITSFRERMSLAVSRAYIETADVAFIDGGGELPLDPETAAWARGQLDAQLGFVDELFEGLREVRKEGDFDAGQIANARADGYSNSLDGFYNEARLRGSGNKMLTFKQVYKTKESCPDCVRLRGQRHRASWWIKHDLVPPKGGGLQCAPGGKCGDALVDDDGNIVTL